MFRRWVPISFIAVAIALALAGGAVLAAGGGDDSRRSDIFERAGQILGIGASELEDAHAQAKRELSDERITAAIEKLVESGLIEQAEADSFAAWMADRPASADDSLFSSLISSAFSLRSLRPILTQLTLPGLGLRPGGDVIERMAEILGLDAQILTDALESGATDSDTSDRPAAMHKVIDDLLESGSITPDEATELNAWVDDIPRWLLDTELSSRLLPTLGLRGGLFGNDGPFGHDGRFGREFKFGLPFGREHLERGDREFRFEFRGPEGTFRFGPGDFKQGELTLPFGDDPFSDGSLQEFLDGFDFQHFGGIEGLEGLKDIEDLLERFRDSRGHGFPVPPPVDPDSVEETPESSTTSA
jgi:polyhydroxyalkanoate synthesis regulator phasin